MQPQSPSGSVPPVAPAPTPAGDVPSMPPVPGVPTPPSPPSQPAAAPGASTAQSKPAELATPEIADDGDLIEKEWVQKVKQLLSKVGDNPYELNQQFMQLKADYMQKRYGKSLKLDK